MASCGGLRIGLESLLDPLKRSPHGDELSTYRVNIYAGLIGHDDQLDRDEEDARLERKIVSKPRLEESDHEQNQRHRKSELRSKVKMFMHGLVDPKKECAEHAVEVKPGL